MAERSIAFGLFAKDNASGVFKKVGVAAQKSAEAVDHATEKLAKATLSQADAAGKVRVAETKLKELRDSGKASATQLAKAEEDLASAQRKQAAATKDVDRATKDMESAQKSARTHVLNLGDSSEKIGHKFGAMAKRAAKAFAIVAAAGVAAAGRIAWSSIGAASDLNETITKTSAIFGDSTAAITAFADTAAVKIGQSKRAALDAAGNFAIFGRSAGLTGGKLVDFSTKLTVLGSDLASFYNTTPEEAITALSAALRGESEPLRKYGVLLNEDALKARALSMELVKNSVDLTKVKTAQAAAAKAKETYIKISRDGNKTDADRAVALAKVGAAEAKVKEALAGKVGTLTMQQKVLAAYGEILEQTSIQQGDYAKTADGLANSQRSMIAQWEDAKAKLGMSLMKPMTDLVNYIRSDLIPAFGDFTAALFGDSSTTGTDRAAKHLDEYGKRAPQLNSLSDSARKLGESVRKLATAFEGLGKALGDEGFTGAIVTTVEFFSGLLTIINGLISGLRTVWAYFGKGNDWFQNQLAPAGQRWDSKTQAFVSDTSTPAPGSDLRGVRSRVLSQESWRSSGDVQIVVQGNVYDKEGFMRAVQEANRIIGGRNGTAYVGPAGR